MPQNQEQHDVVNIDAAIQGTERIFRQVTGNEPAPLGDKPYALIPPERNPAQYVEEQLDRMLGLLSQHQGFAGPMSTTTAWVPPLSASQSDNEDLYYLDVAGVPRDAVEISLSGNMLTVAGERRLTVDGGRANVRLTEIPSGKFSRTIPLATDVLVEQLQAKMHDGVLEIRIPRAAKAAARHFTVQ